MKTETKFLRNYLTKSSYSKGKESVFLVLGLCFLFSWIYWSPALKLSSYLAANYTSIIDKHEYWRLLTTTFVHADLKHLLSNSLMLSVLTYFVSSFYGIRISLGLSYIVATLTNFLVLESYGGATTLVGASGVVFYLWGFWMILYIFLQRQYSIKGRILRMGAIFLILLVPTEYQPNTSYLAHYIGFTLGVLVGVIYYLVNKSKLLKAEVWDIREISDELSDLDEIALNYLDDLEDESGQNKH